MTSRPTNRHPRSAEPRSVGTARAADPLRREVQLLGALLGGVIWEQAGPEAFERVEALRRSSISRRRAGDRATPAGVPADVEVLARAFTLFLLLTNLAEEKHRVRILARRARSTKAVDESAGAAVRALRGAGLTELETSALLARLAVIPVLTAHPTEARRRTVLTAQRRLARLLDRLDDPRLTPPDDAETREFLTEELTILWQTALVRDTRPTPLDEVRSAMAFFDETLFSAVPRLYRAFDRALDPESGTHPPRVGSFLRLGSWVGGDRDGHPELDADVTRATGRIHAAHVLGAHERVAQRLLDTLGMGADPSRLPLAFRRLLRDGRRSFRRPAAELEERYPGQPYRWALGIVRERLRRTRGRLTANASASAMRGGYADAAGLLADIVAIAEALASQGATRVAWGEVQDFAWQVETFGFHLASLELRQHQAVDRAALEVLESEGQLSEPLATPEAGGSVTTGEVLDTFRAAWELQARYGEEACRRYVISFTQGARDVHEALELARRSRAKDPRRRTDPAEPVPLDVVPLLESSDALENADRLLTDLLASPHYRSHLARRGNVQEVMLGYSDSNRELGFLAASWSLYRAQAQLVSAARRAGVELLLFHGRGGAIGRGGGPANRAVLAQPPGSVDGRLKLTQQGEVIAARFSDARIALRELEQMTHAVIVATARDAERHAEGAERRWWPALDELAAEARRAYRALIWEDPAFGAFFRAATPIETIAGMQLGSRPAARGGRLAPPTVASVRAIPWVFSWSQSRIGLPAWFGIGSALAAFRRNRGSRGIADLRRASAEWPFLAGVLDGAALGLAVADLEVGAGYAELAGTKEPMRRIWAAISDEHARSVEEVLAATGRSRLVEGWLEQRIALRNPYVDALSSLQVEILREIRDPSTGAERRAELERLAQMTISGIAAGLQHTG